MVVEDSVLKTAVTWKSRVVESKFCVNSSFVMFTVTFSFSANFRTVLGSFLSASSNSEKFASLLLMSHA